jgi:hypothetical protein
LAKDPVSARALPGVLLNGTAAVGEERNTTSMPAWERSVHIIEEKVFVALSDEGGKDAHRWVLDTGASNHMMGSWVAFTSINAGTTGMMRFSDGSIVCIEGQ